MKKLGAAFVILCLLMAGYSGAWFYAKKRIDAEIDHLFLNAPAKNIAFLGDKPEVTGFPFAPTLHYTDGIKVQNWQISFSDMTIKGFPLPGLPLRASFPGGIIAWIDNSEDSLALQELDITARIPLPLPQSFYADDLAAWQQAGGTVDILDSLVRYDDAVINTTGTIALDENLQPIAELEAAIRGYTGLLQSMIADKQIKPFVGFALLAALNNFAQPASGEDGATDMVATIPVRVVNRSVYVGPALVSDLPQIVWGTRNPPALRQ